MPKEIRSKYQKKNFEEVIFRLDETACHKCDRVFSIDYDKCDEEWDEDEQDMRAVVYCPYCSFKHRVLI